MKFEIIEKIGEGNRGEVYKIKLKMGEIAALKYAKNYEIGKEWQILKFLNGFYAPKPIYKNKKFFIMEYIEGKSLKELQNTPEYYDALKYALKAAFYLDEKKIFHKQLGRYYHIIFNGKNVKFIDFERSVISKSPRNFLQIIGYYLKRDKLLDQSKIDFLLNLYFKDKKHSLIEILKLF